MLIYPRLSHQIHGLWAPLGMMILGTLLEDRGFNVVIEDASFDSETSRVEARIAQERPAVVGVTLLTEFLPAARKILRAAKKAQAITILGGPHPTILPEETLARMPDADYIVIGEGEETLPELLDVINNGNPWDVPGVAARGDGGCIFGPPRAVISDLDILPIPRREMLPTHSRYLGIGALNLHALRGCPFRCAFCQPTLNTLFGKKIRAKSPEAVAEEVEWTVGKYGMKELFFVDDVFTVSKPWLRQVSGLLGKVRADKEARYVINSRVDIFDEEIAQLVTDMGAWIVLFGIESGSQEVLDYLDKGTTVDQSRHAFSLCRRLGLKTHAYVLLGSPVETPESLEATESLVAELAPDSVHISVCMPLPGTTLRQRMEQEGRLNWAELEDLDYYTPRTQRNELPISNPSVTYEQVINTREKILSSRKTRLFLRNARALAADLVRPGGFAKAATRYRYYRRMRHYFG